MHEIEFFFFFSCTRYSPQNQSWGNGENGQNSGSWLFSHKVEPPRDFGFYGIHLRNALYLLMGTGCTSNNCMSSQDADVVGQLWRSDRSLVGIKEGPMHYGSQLSTPKCTGAWGYEHMEILLDQILHFFRPDFERRIIRYFTLWKLPKRSKWQNRSWRRHTEKGWRVYRSEFSKPK